MGVVKYCLWFFGVIGFLLILAISGLMIKADYFKEIHLFNQDKCKTIDIPLPVEDLEIFMGKYLIGGFDDRITLFQLGGIDEAQNGGLIAWRLDDIENTMHQIPLHNFPDKLPFHAHGMYLVQDTQTLFVINHAYKYGGERVEVFKLEEKENKVVAQYMRSIKFTDPNVIGVLNDLTVAGDYIYLSQSAPLADPIEGHDHSSFTQLKQTILSIFSNVGTIRKCRNTGLSNQQEEEAECVEEVKRVLGFGNGITTDGSSTLWAVDNKQRNIAEFEMKQGTLRLKKRIEIHSIIDNLHYERDSGNIMMATVARGIDFINFTNAVKKRQDTSKLPIYSGVSELKFKDGKFETKEDLLLQGKLSSASVAVPYGKGPNRRIFLGSWHDPKLAICSGL